jgi:hypothetical protein
MYDTPMLKMSSRRVGSCVGALLLLFGLGACRSAPPLPRQSDAEELRQRLEQDLDLMAKREAERQRVEMATRLTLVKHLNALSLHQSRYRFYLADRTAIFMDVPPPQREAVKLAALSLDDIDAVVIDGSAYERSIGEAAGFPLLTWPPPSPSAAYQVPRRLVVRSTRPTLGDVATTLTQALTTGGHSGCTFFGVPGGFAVVSKLERIRADGTPEAEGRWDVEPMPLRRFSLSNYIVALIRGRPGYFRALVFVVTPHSLTVSPRPVEVEELQALAVSGSLGLPRVLAKRSFSEQHNVWALVYEFAKEEQAFPKILRPGRLAGEQHFVRSGLRGALLAR